MTFREKSRQYLIENGLFEEQADGVLTDIEGIKEFTALHEVWNKQDEGSPKTMWAVILLSVRKQAVTWIDANCPLHWARPMFAD